MEAIPRFGRDSSEVRVTVGQSFVVELRVHATAGYTWQVAQAPDVAALRDERIRPTSERTGASSLQEFEFHATRRGSGTLRMELRRPWEATSTEALELTVVVTGVS